MKKILGALICAASLLAQTAFAAETVSFNFGGCTDALNRPVSSQADPKLTMVVDTQLVEGNRVIVYNPSSLPQLLPETRAFLYAHECAWTRLGMPINLVRTEANARRADCWAVDTLTRSKLLKAGTLEAVEMDLAMAATDSASQLPGPARELRLASCAGGKVLPASTKTKGTVVNVDTSSTVTATPAWNACMQGCGNRLYACGKSDSCNAIFSQCTAGCGGK